MDDLLYDRIQELELENKQLLNALRVYDVTVACLEPFLDDQGMMGGQIKAAREAYVQATGEQPFKLRKFEDK